LNETPEAAAPAAQGGRTSRATAEAREGGLNVNFSEYLGRPGIADYDWFPMTRKRNFLNMAPRAAGAINNLLQSEEFTYGMLDLRFRISLPEGDPDFVEQADFPALLYDLFDQGVCALVREEVSAAYASEAVDIDTEHAGRNEELQFTNPHARIILQWSYACIACSPMVTAFMEARDIDAKDASGLLMDCFGKLLKRFEPADGSTDIMMKLRKLVESRVLQTRYSDKVMWNYLRNVATDPFIFVDRLYRKFVTEGIPKLDQGTNIIKFFHAFLRYQIKFQFTAKFGLSFRPVRQDVMDGEGMSAMEHLEAELIRRDEGAAVLNEINCAVAIRDLSRSIEGAPTEEEVAHWSAMLRLHGINAWQRGMVTKFFLPHVGRVEVVRTRTLGEYARMLLVARRWLEENDYPCLADYMSARVTEGADGRRLASRKRFVREFMDSAGYQELLGSSFGLSSQAVVDSGVVIEMISAVHINAFEAVPELGEGPRAEGERARAVDHRIEAVAQETLRFIQHIARPPQ
jgi:hypothetical protein